MASGTIDRDRSATRALRRMAGRLVRRAVRALASAEPSARAVHAARKDLKRARTVLRLLRSVLGEPIYRREDLILRDAAHALNAARDAKMLTETLQSLRRRVPSLRESRHVAELLGSLEVEQVNMQRRLGNQPSQLTRTARQLRRLGARADGWHVGRHGWSVLGPALKRLYRRGRRALPPTHLPPSDASLHEWRKQVKYLRYALEMLRAGRSGKLARIARRAECLTDSLGEAHDLAVLARKAHAFAKRNRGDLGPLFVTVERRRTRLAVDSVRSGAELFAEKPRDWQRELSH